MPILKRLLDFYVFSNIHVALAVFCLVKITLLSYENHSNLVPFFCFFSTISSYNLIRIFRVDEVQPWFFEFIKSNKLIIVVLTVLSAITSLYFAMGFRLKTLVWVLPFAIATIFYINPFVKKKQRLSLRYIALVKLFLIAISWAGVTVLIPLVQHNINMGFNEIIIFIQRFLFVVAITIPFDIRDMSHDKEVLKTIPQAIGIPKSKWLGLVCLMFFLGLTFLKSPLQIEQLRIHFFIGAVTLLFLVNSTKNQNKYYSALFVESLPIVWLGLFNWLG